MTGDLLAMHMADQLLTGPVAGATILLAGLAVAVASARLRNRLDAERLPLMGVMGAFVFAAQMINFTLPGMPGTSGHLGGGVLLAILLGPAGAILTMSGILIVQCLIFQDGGLLALGCNILNMGVVPPLLGWGLYRVLLGAAGKAPAWRQYLAAWAACVAAVAAGAALVPIEAGAAGVLRIPLVDFLAVMVGVHLIIGFFEGLITFAVIVYLRRTRPVLFDLPAPAAAGRLSRKALAASLLATAILVAGVVSWFASRHPDGLEWSYLQHRYGQTEQALENPSALPAKTEAFQEKHALLPDYSVRSAESSESWPNVSGWGSLAGIVGTLATLGVVYAIAALLRRRKTAGMRPMWKTPLPPRERTG